MKNLDIDWGAADLLTRDIHAVLELLGPYEEVRDGRQPGTTEYVVHCCGHRPDSHASLVVFYNPHDPLHPVGYHCRAGCSYEDVLRGLRDLAAQAAEEDAMNTVPESAPPAPTSTPDSGKHTTFLRSVFDSPQQWYAGYCGVPVSHIQSLVKEDRERQIVMHTWDSCERYKYRHVHQGTQRPKGQEVLKWSDGLGRPPLWPQIPDVLPEDIALCEGETDCIVLRYWKFCAFSPTAGGAEQPHQRVFDILRARGARRVLIFYDQDTTGLGCRDALTKLCLGSDLVPVPMDLSTFVDPLYGWQKDVRDLQLSGVFAGPDEAHEAITTLLREEAERQQREEFDTLEHRCDIAPENPPWVVPNYMARGAITLISGLPGTGKTTILLSLFSALHDGGDWLGMPVERTKVLYLTEESIVSLKAKRKIYGPMDHIHTMTINEFLDHDWPPDLLTTRIMNTARSVGASLVCIDPLYMFYPVTNESDPAEVKPLFRQYLRYLPRADLALVLTAHDRKGAGNDDGISRVSGTVALAGSCDIVLTMATDPLTGYRRCAIARSRLGDPFTVSATTEGTRFVVVEGADDMKQREADILRFLDDGQWRSKTEIVIGIALDENKLRRPLDRLVDKGRLERRSVLRPRKHDEFRLLKPLQLDLKNVT